MCVWYSVIRGDGMYNVLDVCRYAINYSNKKQYGISNLKLQKVLYFIQAFFLSYTDSHKPCFKDKIEAWDFGPVVPKAYHEFKQFGSGDIPPLTSYINFDVDDVWNATRVEYNEDCIKEEDQRRIQSVIDLFAEYSATDLVALTHNQAPWREAYQPHKNNEITTDAIRRYFDE